MSKVDFKLFLPVFFIIAIWDAFTTVFGTISILGGANVGTIATGVVVAVLMLILFLLTFKIWDDQEVNNEFVAIIFRGLWILAFIYDMFTSFYGNKEFISTGNDGLAAIFVIVLATILVSGSTLIASWLIAD